ncbi:L-idonate 5-dehydrogenase [Phreatobacter cathodiphilus]|uniref:L-idonate 5-dehydrogenase n=1 Tax=Phreatobacter cathodiphilus TaxID=1868589 RepID=A0A2S0NFK7_9HYPH|nr:L-idonate 5-dehydrogenase [Phreatobacter cathodiphilus]AVO46721.1 L-idonate 5-dehydrogenase [Phreatobacter cathodiphilus]
MKALVIHAPHDLRLEEREVAPLRPGEVAVRIGAGGICGSDLHYFHNGGFGAVRLKEPMILGHEIAGTVERVGAEVASVKPGDRVAVSPSRPCGHCRYCLEGMANHCLNMRFYGSAMPFPHIQGAFREVLVCDAVQAHRVAEGVSLGEAAFCEPLAVCLHAARRAGPLLGKRVLVTGCGPIGALCILAARAAGAAEVVATDVAEATLAVVKGMGVATTLNTAADPEALRPYEADKGSFDVLFEASGNMKALTGALAALKPGAVIVQVGTGGDFTLPISVLVAKELELRGTFRFHHEFATAVAMIGERRIDVRPLLTATLPMERAVEAFHLASDRSKAMKVQIAFG